jgi:hypothetical protein
MISMFYFFVIRLIIQTITAITAMTINMPTPIPALKMPSTTEQLVKKNEIRTKGMIFLSTVCMILGCLNTTPKISIFYFKSVTAFLN